MYEGRDRKSGELRWTGTRVDLIFGSHSQLRALAEVYGQSDVKEKFAKELQLRWRKARDQFIAGRIDALGAAVVIGVGAVGKLDGDARIEHSGILLARREEGAKTVVFAIIESQLEIADRGQGAEVVLVGAHSRVSEELARHGGARALEIVDAAEVIEMHHRFKKDAPSGTALRLADIVADQIGVGPEAYAHGREGITGERPAGQIGLHALRTGDKIEIRGFGSFRTRSRQPRVGRNPKTGSRVEVPAKRFWNSSSNLNLVFDRSRHLSKQATGF